MHELTIVEMKQNKIEELKEYYAECKDSTVWSCLQGYNGKIFVDNVELMNHTMLLVGDFLFPSSKGEFSPQIAADMLTGLNDVTSLNDLLIIPQSEEWKSYLDEVPIIKKITRFAIHKKKVHEFDCALLEELVNGLGNEFCFRKIDEEIAERVLKEPWSRSFCCNFNSPRDFVERGLGVVIMHGDEVVCGASSYTVYKKGIEVEISTKEAYRKVGLATACGAKLILMCKKEGLEVNWDAANIASVRIAERLGFTYDKEYTTYLWGDSSI